MAQQQENNNGVFSSIFSSTSQVLENGVTVNVAFDYVSTAYLAIGLFVAIMAAMVGAQLVLHSLQSEKQ